MNNDIMPKIKWPGNVIIVDADYVDKVVFNLIVNFERMIGRHIPQADMSRWVEFVAIDGGLQPLKSNDSKKEESNQTQVILLHGSHNDEMNNFSPSVYSTELTGQAFNGDYGEFIFTSVPTEDCTPSLSKLDILYDLIEGAGSSEGVKRLMVVADFENSSTLLALHPVLKALDREKSELRITLFSMNPLNGIPCRQEILGYSLMAALGIRSSEIK